MTMSALAYADPANPVILPEEGATSLNANTINQNMGPDVTVWVQNTFGSEIELNSGSPSIPANSEGLIIGGTSDTAKIKLQTNNLLNINQTTVQPNGAFTVSGASGTSDYFDTSLSIEGGTVQIKKGTFSMRSSDISISSGSLEFLGRVRVGYNSDTTGASTLTQTGGTVTIQAMASSEKNQYFIIGYYSGSEGELNISGGTFTTAMETKIGDSGTGTFNLTGGVFNQTAGWANLGYEASGKGTMTVNGGTFNYTVNDFRVGRAGSGELNLESGTFNLGSKFLVVGYYEGSTGEFNMTGGTLTAKGLTIGDKPKTSSKDAASGTATFTNIANQSFSGDVTVGSSGNGKLTLDNSSITTTGYLYIGKVAGASGEVTLKNGSTFTSPSHSLRIGQEGTGVVNVLSGSTLNSSGQDIHIAYSSTGDGTLNIDGGAVKANHIMVGSAGTGLLEVKNGTIDLASGKVLYVGYAAGTVGTFNMSGADSKVTVGLLHVGENTAKVGEDNKPIANVATISGGSFTSLGNIFVAAESGSLGILNVEGGTLTGKGELRIGRYGDGTMAVKNNAVVSSTGVVNVGQYDGSTGVLNVEGGTLEAKTDFYVGNVGKGTMNISGGNVTPKGKLYVAYDAKSTSEIKVTGGSLTGTSELLVGYYGKGTVTITGGDVSFAGLVNVGFETGAVGDLSIKNGTFSNPTSSSTLRIGRKGTGTVEVLEGGKLIVENTNTQLGYYEGGNGTLTIDGGTANLNTLQIGFASGSTGALEVLGGKLNVFNEISVGYDGTGSAAISGGVVTTGNFVVKSGMSAALNGGTLNVASYVNEGTTTFNGATINLGSGGVINSTGTFTATSGSVIVTPGDYYSESDQVLIGRFADADTANSVKNLTTVPEGWTMAVIDLSGSSAVIAQKGSEPTGVKIWNAGTEGNMSNDSSWSGDTSNNTGYVFGGTNKFKDFAGDLVLVDGTNTFSINAPVPSGHILVNDGGTTTYGSGDISMNGTLIVNGGTFQTASGKTLVIAGTESDPAYLEVNGGTLNVTRRLTIGNVASSDNTKPSAKVVINSGNVQVGGDSGGLHVGQDGTESVVGELELNGGKIQINNSRPTYIATAKKSAAKFTMTNGSFTTDGTVSLATGEGSVGTLKISGGTFSTTNTIDVATGKSSNGTIEISNGVFTTTNTLTIATGTDSTGTIEVSGGKVKAKNIKLGRANAGDSAQLNITGGVVEITNAIYGSDSSPSGNVSISGTGQLLLNSTYSSSTYAGIRELSALNIAGVGDGSGAMLFVKSLDSSVPITLTNDATIGISSGATFTQREAINIVPKRSATQPALTVTGGGTLVLTNSELGSLDELTVDGDGTTVKIDNPGNTTNLHMSSIVLNSGAMEFTEGTILDPGYGDDELPTTVAIEGDGRVILKGVLFLDAYTTDQETGMDKLDFSGFNGDLTLANPLNLTVHLNNASDFLGQVVTLDWLIADAPEELYNIDNVNLTLVNDEGISFLYWLNADGSITFGDHNAIPEPSTWALLILGSVGLLYWRKRNRKA